jgi:hypothetical protein
MQLTHFSTPATLMVAILMTACGGGGGGSSPAAPAPVTSLASLAAKDIPAQWPDSFKAVTVSNTQLVSATELALTSNQASAIFIQIWYLDQDQQRQPVAFLTLAALTRMGSSITIPKVPGGVRVLQSEVYTSNGSTQQTLASKDIAL